MINSKLFILSERALYSSQKYISSKIIDFRSDVLTKPTSHMLNLLNESTFNDEIFREDNTVKELENATAKLFGKEAALFVPSGTMANIIGVASHCPRRDHEVILGDKSHIYTCEQGGISQLFGLHACALENLEDGSLNLSSVEDSIKNTEDPHEAQTGMIAIESSHNILGGRPVPIGFMKKLKELAQKFKLPVHLDGARVLNTAVALKVAPLEISKHVDSLTLCYSKGLGAPIGSAIIGSNELIRNGLRLRKLLGGGWRKPGGLAAAALFSLNNFEQKFKQDHDHAKLLAIEINKVRPDLVQIDIDKVETNIFLVNVIHNKITPREICNRLRKVSHNEQKELGESIQVWVNPARARGNIRVCTCCNISTEDIHLAIKKWNFVLKNMN